MYPIDFAKARSAGGVRQLSFHPADDQYVLNRIWSARSLSDSGTGGCLAKVSPAIQANVRPPKSTFIAFLAR